MKPSRLMEYHERADIFIMCVPEAEEKGKGTEKAIK